MSVEGRLNFEGNGSIDMFPQAFIDYVVSERVEELREEDRDRLIQEQVD